MHLMSFADDIIKRKIQRVSEGMVLARARLVEGRGLGWREVWTHRNVGLHAMIS